MLISVWVVDVDSCGRVPCSIRMVHGWLVLVLILVLHRIFRVYSCVIGLGLLMVDLLNSLDSLRRIGCCVWCRQSI